MLGRYWNSQTVGAAINVIGALTSIVLLTLVMTALEMRLGVDPEVWVINGQ